MKIAVSAMALAFALYASSASSQDIEDNENVETAARINVAENVCDINFGERLLHHVMLAASELRMTVDQVAVYADVRHREILSYLKRNRKLDEFCANAKRGKL
jgi:hypothetical protein